MCGVGSISSSGEKHLLPINGLINSPQRPLNYSSWATEKTITALTSALVGPPQQPAWGWGWQQAGHSGQPAPHGTEPHAAPCFLGCPAQPSPSSAGEAAQDTGAEDGAGQVARPSTRLTVAHHSLQRGSAVRGIDAARTAHHYRARPKSTRVLPIPTASSPPGLRQHFVPALQRASLPIFTHLPHASRTAAVGDAARRVQAASQDAVLGSTDCPASRRKGPCSDPLGHGHPSQPAPGSRCHAWG